MADIMRLIPFALKLVQNSPQLKQLAVLLTPAVDELKIAAPQLIPLLRQLGRELFPELMRQFDDRGPGELVTFDVQWLQSSLNKLGASPKLQIDGDYGPLTKEAVRKFQERHGLEADGWAGIVTCAAVVMALQR